MRENIINIRVCSMRLGFIYIRLSEVLLKRTLQALETSPMHENQNHVKFFEPIFSTLKLITQNLRVRTWVVERNNLIFIILKINFYIWLFRGRIFYKIFYEEIVFNRLSNCLPWTYFELFSILRMKDDLDSVMVMCRILINW